MNILIIDDTKTNIDLLLELLDEYNIFVATDGPTGLDILKENDIDLVLLDIMMPDMDGYEVCQIIRNTPKISETPIIFLTAKSQEEDIEKAYEVGGNDYITKPFKQKELLARVHMQLQIKNHNKTLENLLMQQSKMAQMGEMVDAIAHQWIQPINVISLSVQVLALEFAENKVDLKYIENFKNNINLQIEHLVQTLDEFRYFFRPIKQKEKFDVKNIIEKVFILLNEELKHNNINISIEEKSAYKLYGNENEFKHILINLINNSKDAYIENQIRKRDIIIAIDGDNKTIEFIDNAGGISENIIDKIFDMNYTTKKKGSGMGLYMSRKIAKKLSLTLDVENLTNGVKFILKGI